MRQPLIWMSWMNCSVSRHQKSRKKPTKPGPSLQPSRSAQTQRLSIILQTVDSCNLAKDALIHFLHCCRLENSEWLANKIVLIMNESLLTVLQYMQ